MIFESPLPGISLMNYLVYFCFSILLTTILVPIFMKVGKQLNIIDKPGLRKIHLLPIPRTGGFALIIGGLIPVIFFVKNNRLLIGICLGAICILIVGLIDDIWDLSYRWKFLGQFTAGAVTLLVSNIRLNSLLEVRQGFTFNLKVLSFLISLFFLVATSNIINLSDGLDGLAGGICLLIFSFTAIFAYFREGAYAIALSICMIGAIIGFLRYNTFPATVFLGDTGSLFLGFTVGVSLILLTQGHTIYSPIISFYIIGVPIFDTIMVILERWMDGRAVFQADKNHIHHKLLKMGFRHNEAVVIIYAVQLLMGLLAWNLRFFTDVSLMVIYLFLLGSFLVFFLLFKKGFLCIPPIHKQLNQHNDKIMQNAFLSRKTISHLTWYGLVGGMFLFCLFTPFVVRSVSWDIGLICFLFIACILVLKKFKTKFTKTIIKLSAYFISLFYIYSLEYQIKTFPLIYTMLFIGMGGCYLFYLITTLEKIPIFNMDYLLLAVILFVSFIPKTYRKFIHLNHIAVQTLFVFLFIELLFYKIKEKKLTFMQWSIFYALSVTCIFALCFT